MRVTKYSEEIAILKSMGINLSSTMVVFEKCYISEHTLYAAVAPSASARGCSCTKKVIDYLITDIFMNAFDDSEKEHILNNARKMFNGERIVEQDQSLYDTKDLKKKALFYLNTVDHKKFKNMYYILKHKKSRLAASRVYPYDIRRIK